MSFYDLVEGSFVEINERKIPLFFSLRAASQMEKVTGIKYPVLMNRLFLEQESEAEGLMLEDQMKVLACVVQEGERKVGKQVRTIDEIVETIADLMPEEFGKLTLAVVKEMYFKSARKEKSVEDEKNL